jgi:hypothetical protein
MDAVDQIARMNAQELREFAADVVRQLVESQQGNRHKQLKIDVSVRSGTSIDGAPDLISGGRARSVLPTSVA